MKKVFLSLLCGCLALAAAGCGSQASPSKETTNAAEQVSTQTVSEIYPYSFDDSTGVQVTLEEPPKKVAVLFSSYAEIWTLAGGHTDITVGEAVERGFADSSAVLVDEGSGHSTIDMEALVAAEPDLVIGTADYECQTDAVNFCRQSGIPAALFKVESFHDYLTVLDIFSQITCMPQNYAAYGTEVQLRIDSLMNQVKNARLNGTIGTPDILFVRAGSSARSTKAKTAKDNFACLMLQELGCNNIADQHSELTGELSLEAIVENDPAYLLVSTMGDETAAKDYMNSLLQSDGWKDLSCVKDGHVDYLPKDLFHYKPNARWADAYEYLIHLIYPELTLEN